MSRLLRLTLLFLLITPLLDGQLASQQTPQSQKRLALVIGNGNYTSSILANPENDAADMSNVLRLMGFEVLFHVNLGMNKMLEAIDDFGMKLPNYDVGLFYFSGHGIQSGGKNYLVPIDAKLTIERMIQFDCIEVDRVLAYMDEAKTGVNVIILDACRNNPFEKSWSRALGGPGLASMDAPKGTLIAYATAPNKTASDGSGRNGLYTSAILESIINPDMTAIQIFQNVTSLVLKRSNQQQIPWLASSLTADFYFNPYKVPGQTTQATPLYLSVSRKPELSVPDISNITSSGATVNARITADGGSDVFDKGIYYSTTPEPSAKNGKKIEIEGGYESFSYTLIGLDPNKTYYVRAYARNSVDIGYSQKQVIFKTDPGKPVITTENISKVTSNSAFASASITDDGAAPILLRGFCWSTLPNPTARNKDLLTQNGKGKGTFTNPIGFLLPDSTYYLRAYCSNNGKDTIYGNEVKFKALRFDQFVDIDGNTYGSVKLVNLTWMTENLRTTRLNDGTNIPLVSDNAAWSSQVSPAYCWYENKEENKETYGALYNLETVKSGKLCPIGWHVPTDEDWTLLYQVSGGSGYAGGNLKERGFEHWLKPNIGVESFYNRFRALPGGERNQIGEFNKKGTSGNWWSDVDPRKGVSWSREIISNSVSLKKNKVDNNSVGFSVRCVKDQD
jgi:uncharacterized protein (TIGR02145 family)